MNKKIKFLGDSFVWGQSLDWYDFGIDKSRFDTDIQNNLPSQFINNYIKGDFFTYPYDNYNFNDINSKRYLSIVDRRWSTQVCKHFNTTGIQHWLNGGSPLQVVNNLLNNTDEDIIIILISDYRRDQWGHQLNNLPPYTKYMSNEVFTKLVLIDMIGEYRYDMELSKNKKLEKKYQQQLINLTSNGIWELQKHFYIAYFKYLMEWKEKHNKDIYFIGSWLEDAELLIKHDEPEIQWYKNNLIPIFHNNVRYNSFYPLIESGMTIDNDFDIHWSDHHPTQELHNSVAKSVIKFLEENHNV